LFVGDASATAASVSSTAAGSGSGLKRRTTPRPARRRMASLPASVSGTAPISPKRRSSSSCRVFMESLPSVEGDRVTPGAWPRTVRPSALAPLGLVRGHAAAAPPEQRDELASFEVEHGDFLPYAYAERLQIIAPKQVGTIRHRRINWRYG